MVLSYQEFEARKKAAFAASEARTAERNRLKQLWEDRITEEKKEQDDNSASTVLFQLWYYIHFLTKKSGIR
jgi:hypothetical protein